MGESLPASRAASSDLSTTRSPSSATHQRTCQSARTTTHSSRTGSSPRRGGSRLSPPFSIFRENLSTLAAPCVESNGQQIFGDHVDLPHPRCNFLPLFKLLSYRQ